MINLSCVLARFMMEATEVKVCSSVGFPFGATLAEAQSKEAKHAVKPDAEELDMVVNISALKSKDYTTVKKTSKPSSI